MRSLAFSAAFLLAAAPARAQHPENPYGRVHVETAPAENVDTGDSPPRRFYGWQNIVVGYAGAALMVHGFLSDSPMVTLTGAATYGLGGTIVHAVHGNAFAAALSPVIMIGAPLLLGTAAASADSEELAALAVLYIIGAPAIDGALGREPAAKKETISVMPSVRRDTVGFSIAGVF